MADATVPVGTGSAGPVGASEVASDDSELGAARVTLMVCTMVLDFGRVFNIPGPT